MRMNLNFDKIDGVRGFRTLTGALLASGLVLSIMTGAEPAPAPSRTAWDKVFSKEQAERGRRFYNTLCARCHGESLGGGETSPGLVDESFFKVWAGKTVGELVEYNRTRMPSDGPGTITRKRCTDIIAYLLSANGFPAGEGELPPALEIQNRITITPKK
jgi:mono/diheme cytochrome c family protein